MTGSGHPVQRNAMEAANAAVGDKSTYSSMDAPEVLAAMEGKRAVVLTGVVADCCILATMFDAIDLGYEVVYLYDCIAGASAESEAEIRALAEIFQPIHTTVMSSEEYLAAIGANEMEANRRESEVESNGEVYVLFTSDVHCGIDQGFGYAGLKQIRDTLEAQGYTTILVDDGDSIQGEPIGTLTQGEANIELMNEMGYDIAIPGNHEYDYGMEASCAPWTYADVIEHTTGIDVFLDGHSHDTEQVIMKDADGNPVTRSAVETNLGDFCADVIRFETGADIAMISGGEIRADIKKGDITYGDIMSVWPYENEFCVLEVTGQQILDALEWGSRSLPGENASFQQVSGLSYEIDVSVPSGCVADENNMMTGIEGERRVKNVTVGDEPLGPEKTYTLAGPNYTLMENGDGFTAFDGATVLMESAGLDTQLMIDYITNTLGGVIGSEYADPYGQGRIVITE